MKWTMPTKTIEVFMISYIDNEYVLKALKGNSLFNCLSQVTEDVQCMVSDGELKTVQDIIDRLNHNNENGGDDVVLSVRDVTNKDYVYVYELVDVSGDSVKICKNFEGR